MGGNERCPLLKRSVHIHRYRLPVPMQLLRRIGIIVDIDDDLLAFLAAQQGARKLPVASGGGSDASRVQFNEPVADRDGMFRWALRRNVRAGGRLSLDPFVEGCRE